MVNQSACSGQGLLFARVDADRITDARKGENVAVMFAQPIREQALLLPIHTNEQRDQQADAATIHNPEHG